MGDVQNFSSEEVSIYLKENLELGEDIVDLFKEADVDGQTFVSLNRADVTDLLPGAKYLRARKKIMSVLENKESAQSDIAGIITVTISGKEYKLYSTGALAGRTIQKQALNEVVRGTVKNMVDVLNEDGRFPNSTELESMAKKMVHHYPVLKDQEDSDKPWAGFLILLKRRLANIKPTRRPQGSTPKRSSVKRKEMESPGATPKSKSRRTEDTPEHPLALTPRRSRPEPKDPAKNISKDFEPDAGQQSTSASGDGKADQINPGADGSDEDETSEPTYDAQVMAKHYEMLYPRMTADRLNASVVNHLLDLERPARRQFIQSLPSTISSSSKIDKILKGYPIFSRSIDYVVGELCRILDLKIDVLIKSMEESLEKLVMYGLLKKSLSLDNIKTETKYRSVLLQIGAVLPIKTGQIKSFVSAEKKKKDSVMATAKKNGLPVLVEYEGTWSLVGCGREFDCAISSAGEALIKLLAIHYCFELPWPPSAAALYTVWQSTVLQDEPHPDDKNSDYSAIMKALEELS